MKSFKPIMSWLTASLLYQKLQMASCIIPCYLYRIQAEICRGDSHWTWGHEGAWGECWRQESDLPEFTASVLFPPLVVSAQLSLLVRLEENNSWHLRFWHCIVSKGVFRLYRQQHLLLKLLKTTVFTLIKHGPKLGISVAPIGVREGNEDLAWCHYL